jgi:simple sugar transport system permease protein
MLTTLNVNTNAVPVFKAVIIIMLVVIQTPIVKSFFDNKVTFSKTIAGDGKERS